MEVQLYQRVPAPAGGGSLVGGFNAHISSGKAR